MSAVSATNIKYGMSVETSRSKELKTRIFILSSFFYHCLKNLGNIYSVLWASLCYWASYLIFHLTITNVFQLFQLWNLVQIEQRLAYSVYWGRGKQLWKRSQKFGRKERRSKKEWPSKDSVEHHYTNRWMSLNDHSRPSSTWENHLIHTGLHWEALHRKERVWPVNNKSELEKMGCCPTKTRVESTTRESAVGELLQRVTHISAGFLLIRRPVTHNEY